MQTCKVVIVGDGAVGKTCFVVAFTYNVFPQDYVPTVFDNYSAVIEFEGRQFNLALWDTAGQTDFEKLRPMSYEGADIFLLFFSIINPTSYDNVKDKWIQEIRQYNPNIPVILVGTKADQRNDKNVIEKLLEQKQQPITTAQGTKLAAMIGAVRYYECSAKEMTGMREIFDEVIRTVANFRVGKKPGKVCWSINCRKQLPLVPKSPAKKKCKGCRHYYCYNCIEIWADNFEGCPRCIENEKSERKKRGLPLPDVKKPGKGKTQPDEVDIPADEQIVHDTSNNTTNQNVGESTRQEDEGKEKRTKAIAQSKKKNRNDLKPSESVASPSTDNKNSNTNTDNTNVNAEEAKEPKSEDKHEEKIDIAEAQQNKELQSKVDSVN
jgi:small GTP-binding protein